MEIEAFGLTDVGKVREANEDSFLIDAERNLFIVADGMGGHKGGGYASSNAVSGIKNEIARMEESQDTTAPAQDDTGRTPLQVRMNNALLATNEILYQTALADSSLRGMGTTVTAIQLDHDSVNIAHVGDSRLYMLRDGELSQVTNDHSWVQEQVDAGLLTEEEAKTHPLKNIITRSMGHDRDLLVDLLKEEYRPNDVYFMCSDGLSNMVEDDIVHKVLLENEPEPAAKELIRLALEAGGVDNITVVIVKIKE